MRPGLILRRLAVIGMLRIGVVDAAAQYSERLMERHSPEFLENFGPALGKPFGPALSKPFGPALSKPFGPALSKPFGPAFRSELGPDFILNFLLDIANERFDAHISALLRMQEFSPTIR